MASGAPEIAQYQKELIPYLEVRGALPSVRRRTPWFILHSFPAGRQPPQPNLNEALALPSPRGRSPQKLCTDADQEVSKALQRVAGVNQLNEVPPRVRRRLASSSRLPTLFALALPRRSALIPPQPPSSFQPPCRSASSRKSSSSCRLAPRRSSLRRRRPGTKASSSSLRRISRCVASRTPPPKDPFNALRRERASPR